MPKKGTNIYKRKDGRWEARYVKAVSIDGYKKYGSVYGKTYSEARDKQLQCLQNLKPTKSNCTSLIFSELLNEWLSSIQYTVKKSTYQKYESIIRNHIESHTISKMQVRYITSKTIGCFSNDKLQSGNLSAKTVNDILVVVGLSLSYADEVYSITKPKINHIKEPKKEMRVLSIAEQQVLESYLNQDLNLYKVGILLALYTGIRVGELCALQWDDITNENLIVNKTLHRIKEGHKTILEITEPKTKTSNRVIPLPQFLIPILSKFRSTGSVMQNRNGKVVEPRLMQLTFEKYIDDCGLEKTNFHSLRHTFATRCVEAGFDIKSLSEILGHTDVKTTLNKYVHSSMQQKQKNMELLKPARDL